MMRLGCWWSRKECPKTVNYEFWKDKEQNSWDTNSPRFQVRERVSVFQHLLINAKKVASMILRRGEFLSLFLSLVCLQHCYANGCIEAVEEACSQVIVENNDQLLETMEEMVSNRSCNASSNPLLESQLNELNNDMILHFSNVSNQIRDMKEDLGDTRNTMEQILQKMENPTLG